MDTFLMISNSGILNGSDMDKSKLLHADCRERVAYRNPWESLKMGMICKICSCLGNWLLKSLDITIF